MRQITLYALLCILSLGTSPVAADELKDAEALLKRGKAELALQKIETHVAAKPQDMPARFMKGVILSEMGRADEAKAVFRQLTTDFPEAAEPYNNLAVLYAAGGDFQNAREALEMAVRVNPKYVTAFENLGDVYAQLAARAYDKAAVLDSASNTARNKLKLARELTADTSTKNIATP